MMQHFLSKITAALLGTADELGLPTSGGSVGNAQLKSIMGVVYMVAVVIAVVVIIIAGILYATSSGDAAKITRAKKAILYSIIGLIVVIIAFTITNLVISEVRVS